MLQYRQLGLGEGSLERRRQLFIGYGTDHQALGRGDLDAGRLLDRLAEVGFAGPIIFELTVPEALESLDVIRRSRPGLVDRAFSPPSDHVISARTIVLRP